MKRIIDPLSAMGAKVESAESGKPPLRITGNQNLKSFSYQMPMASAQVKSCLLLAGLYASGTTRVSYDGKSVDYGSAEDLLARIRTIERAIAGTARPLPVAGLAGFSRGDR